MISYKLNLVDFSTNLKKFETQLKWFCFCFLIRSVRPFLLDFRYLVFNIVPV